MSPTLTSCPVPALTPHTQVEPQSTPLPMGYDERLSPFEKLLVLRMLRPDKVVPAIQVGGRGAEGGCMLKPTLGDRL